MKSEKGDNAYLKLLQAKFENLCDEDKIVIFFQMMLDEWYHEFDETCKKKPLGKQYVGWCDQHLQPLIRICKDKALPSYMKQALLMIIRCCIKRDYEAAGNKYIKLSIGNAPWPVGVTRVGIHECSDSVAHNETSRKYLQAVKKLMTFCQRKYPKLSSGEAKLGFLLKDCLEG